MSDPNTATPSLCRRLDHGGIPSLLARLIVGGVMIWMSLSKIDDPVTFLKLLRDYDMFPAAAHVLMNLIVVVLPWIEFIGGVLLILGWFVRGTAAVMLAMLIAFTGIIFVRMMDMVRAGKPFFEVKFDCGCGGGEQIIWLKLLSNLGLILCAGWLLYAHVQRFRLGRATRPQ